MNRPQLTSIKKLRLFNKNMQIVPIITKASFQAKSVSWVVPWALLLSYSMEIEAQVSQVASVAAEDWA